MVIMIVGIHQPHYFPWMGYFDKMAKSDVFILLDLVQMEKGSYMYRNRIVNAQGNIAYLTISGDKHGFLDKAYNDINTINDEIWLGKQKAEIERAYKESCYYDEIWDQIKELFALQEHTICAYCVRSIMKMREILGISTPIVMQSDLPIDDTKRKNDLVLHLCQTINADKYLSGNGAKKYTDESSFEKAGITIRYQQFEQPEYKQLHTNEFIPGLSLLDVLFNCGTEKTRDLFWTASQKGREFK